MMKYGVSYGSLHFLTKKEDDDPNEQMIFMFGMAWKKHHLYRSI